LEKCQINAKLVLKKATTKHIKKVKARPFYTSTMIKCEEILFMSEEGDDDQFIELKFS
jgi:hypothetical protein